MTDSLFCRSVKRNIILASLVIFLFSCQKAGSNLIPGSNNNLYFISATPARQLSKSQLQTLYAAYGASSYIRNGIKTYTVRYKTKTYTGAVVTASCSIVVPDAAGPYPLINYNHGTFFPEDEWRVPSYNNDFNSDINITYMMASVGYVVVAPDYIGYGASKSQEHNYCDYYSIAINVVDAIRAAKEFCSNQNFSLKNKFFITGWSEGGTVTMATVRNIQENFAAEFSITAAAPLAGAYYTSGLASAIINMNTETPFINSYTWALKTYNKTGNINKPLSYYINEPHATAFNASVSAVIPKNPQVLFTSQFRQNMNNNTDPIISVLQQNDVWNFKPVCKTVLCHGQNDTYVPLANSQQAYNYMLAQGADVSLIVYPGKDHGECIWDYLATIYQAFEPLR